VRRPFATVFSFALLAASIAWPGIARAADPAAPSPAPPIKAATPPKPATPTATPAPTPTPGPAYSNMTWRDVGPATAGGRVAAVAGSATDPKLYYVGSAGGGVWKTANGGQTWSAVFESQKVGAIGAVVIDPTDDNTVWVGTGEANPRNDVSYGDGVYKTTDGGKTWTNMGLPNSRHISRILVDPRNHDRVIVGVLGDVFADSPDRGVYVTNDGGKTWTQTLYVGPQTGVSDLAFNAQNPDVVYAGMWQFRRIPWNFTSGGPDDGLYRSTDAGRTWTKLTGHGLPDGVTGRIGLATAPSDGRRVYATIEANGGILWRSDDGGDNWTMVSDDTLVDQRPFYFSHLAVDPSDANRVYAVSEMLAVSANGGKKFTPTAFPVHVDYHAMWIAPNDPTRMIVGEDGGFALTQDKGRSWFFSANLPIAQIYHVGLSNENPYTLCVGLQDNNAWCGPSNSLDQSGIPNKYWISVNGGDGEWAIPDPSDPNWIWSDSENGSLLVYNKSTQDGWFAMPYLGDSQESYDLSTSKYRFNWDSPIAFAPWNPHIGWLGGDVVFQTTDRGIHWKVISPDLTLNDKTHQQPTGGPITHDVSGAEYSDTIIDIEGSTLRAGEIWVGTDDGLVQLTRDSGKHWSNVTPPGVPPYGRVETIAPSTLQSGVAYATIDRHRSGDYKPYVFVTRNYGRTWASIINGLPVDQYVRTIRPDIRNANVLYAGTEQGVWLSQDGGNSWVDFKNGLPTVSVRDIRMQSTFDDLVIATHGRSVYIMDDMRPIQELSKAVAAGDALFAPRVAYEYSQHSNDEGTYTEYTGTNPGFGVIISFYQKEAAKTAPKVEILDDHGKVIRTVAVKSDANKAGLNRYVWDFQNDGPIKWTGAAKPAYEGPDEGISVPRGNYSVRMKLGGHTYVQPIVVKPDPRSAFTLATDVQSYTAGNRALHQYSTIDTMLNNLDSIKATLDTAAADPKGKADAALTAAIVDAQAKRATLFSTLTADFHNDEDSIQRPGALREDYQGLYYAVQGPITPAVLDLLGRLETRYRAAIAQYNDYVTKTLPPINTSLTTDKLKPIPATVKTVSP
jgi:photosystem II stability/assembly factor-like uncharacterized protein